MDQHGKIVKIAVERKSDLSTWIKGSDQSYETEFSLKGLKKGHYTWLIGLVDTTKDNLPGIQMAVSSKVLHQGWMAFGMLKIK